MAQAQNRIVPAVAIRLYGAGRTLAEIAERLGSDRMTISRVLHIAGIKLRQPGQQPKDTARGYSLERCAGLLDQNPAGAQMLFMLAHGQRPRAPITSRQLAYARRRRLAAREQMSAEIPA